jgi:hypothetical protein
MTISFRQRLKQGDTLIGALLQMPLPEVAEIFVEAGYDWLFVDMEHSPMDARAALNILTAVDTRVPCVVRVPWNDEAYIKRGAGRRSHRRHHSASQYRRGCAPRRGALQVPAGRNPERGHHARAAL